MSKTNWQSDAMKRIYRYALESLKEEVEKKGMSYELFKEESGISRTVFEKWEIYTMLTKTTIDRCADYLNIDRTKLISRNDYAKLHKGHFAIDKEQKDKLDDMGKDIQGIIAKDNTNAIEKDDIETLTFDEIEDALIENELKYIFASIDRLVERAQLLLKKIELNEVDDDK